ncbi:MAG: hypothetical protein H3Z52_12735, partial [archaeon]|nr:hypothetical protein [archaeon]MCP8321784.1 hypothetical protein [archaeon]
MNIKHDPKLPIICKEVLRQVPYVESIILCGSRAKIKAISPYSDYDVIVVMRTCLIPIYLSKLKKIEHMLSKRWGVKVGIDPMPMFRVRCAKGNLFLYKVKREGLTIWGKDLIALLDPGDAKDISLDWYFSYLSSLMREMVQTFDPVYLRSLDQSTSKELTKSAAKALIGCGELFFLLRGFYVEDPDVMVSKLKETDSSNEYAGTFVIDSKFLEGL